MNLLRYSGVTARRWMLFVVLLTTLLPGCQSEHVAPPPLARASATVPPTLTVRVTTTPRLPTVTLTTVPPTDTLPAASPSPSPTATPDPIHPFTIDGLRARPYPGGEIQRTARLEENASFTRYAIAYPSDGLTITGILQQPPGEGPFPVLILLHGYWDRADYRSGNGTAEAAAYFNRHGYLTIAPDLRSWGGSDSGPSLFHTGLLADALNLISSLPSLPEAAPTRLGIWGHSMGGGLATKLLTVDARARAAVLYAPNSADDAQLIARWGAGCQPGQSQAAGDRCNPAEVIPPELPEATLRAYLDAAASPAALRRIAPIHHLGYITVPVQIHIGTADGAALVETPPEWSTELYDALRAADKEASLFVYPDQGHFFRGASWELMMERARLFFDQALK